MTDCDLCLEQGLQTVDLPDTMEGEEQHLQALSCFPNLVAIFSTSCTKLFGMWQSHVGNGGVSCQQYMLIERALQRPILAPKAIQGVNEQCQQYNSTQSSYNGKSTQLIDVMVNTGYALSLERCLYCKATYSKGRPLPTFCRSQIPTKSPQTPFKRCTGSSWSCNERLYCAR